MPSLFRTWLWPLSFFGSAARIKSFDKPRTRPCTTATTNEGATYEANAMNRSPKALKNPNPSIDASLAALRSTFAALLRDEIRITSSVSAIVTSMALSSRNNLANLLRFAISRLDRFFSALLIIDAAFAVDVSIKASSELSVWDVMTVHVKH